MGDEMNQDISALAYAPRRQRLDRPKSEILPATPSAAESKPLSANAARIAMQIEEIQQERDTAVRREQESAARLEQFQSRVTKLESDLETSKLETAEADRRAQGWQAEVIRLKAILENCGGLIADGLVTQRAAE